MLSRRMIKGWLAVLLMFSPSVSAEPAGIMDRAFFYNDIYHFVGQPYRSPLFSEIRKIAQPFTVKCSNLNRLILPLYLNEEIGGRLAFNLYQDGKENEPLFSTEIDVERLPAPAKIGTHGLMGVLYNVWIPPQSNSKNKRYVWELSNTADHPSRGVGFFLTRAENTRLQAASFDAVVQEKVYSAFYAYCGYSFDWGNIIATTWERLSREKIFLCVLLIVQGGLIVGIMRLRM